MLDRYFESARTSGPSLISPEEAGELLAGQGAETDLVGSSGLSSLAKGGVGGLLLVASIATLLLVLPASEEPAPTVTVEAGPIARLLTAEPTEDRVEELREVTSAPGSATPLRARRSAPQRVTPPAIALGDFEPFPTTPVLNDIAMEMEFNEELLFAESPTPTTPSRHTWLKAVAEPVSLDQPSRTTLGVRQISALNTTVSHEYNPLVSPDGNRLYFTSSTVNGLGGHDIWVTSLSEEGTFSPPLNLGSGINSTTDEGGITLSLDGTTMIYTSCERSDGLGECDLYEARFTPDGWREVRNLTELNTRDWESHPSLSSDGSTLYFVSDRPGTLGGYGDRDIFVSTRLESGVWSTPVNLGPGINTKKKEDSPFIPPGSEVLYFSSEGHDGVGGYDFYKADRRGDEWGEPVNLGPTINSEQNERFLSVSAGQDRIYFARDDEDGYFDLWIVEREAQNRNAVLSGSVRDTERNDYIRADLLFVDHESGTILGQGSTAGADGRYNLILGTDQMIEGGKIDVYGVADQLGSFTAQVDLPQRISHAAYSFDLRIEPSTPSDHVGLEVTLDGRRILLRSESDAEVATILGRNGLRAESRLLPGNGDGEKIVEIGTLPDGLYLVRIGEETGFFRIE